MRGLDQQRLKDAFWKARAAKYILDRDCALRNIRPRQRNLWVRERVTEPSR